MLRRLVKTGLAWGLHGAGADAMLGRLVGRRSGPLILGYHRVVEDGALGSVETLPGMVIGLGMLERHLDWVGRHHRFVSVEELGATLERGEPLSAPVAAVTFDDGYADVFENAFPLLRRKGIPAAFFVVTDWLGTRDLLVYDRLYLLLEQARRRGRRSLLLASAIIEQHAPCLANGRSLRAWRQGSHAVLRALLPKAPQANLLRLAAELEAQWSLDDRLASELRPMSWEMVEDLNRAGMTVGSHTRTHALLTREGPARVRDELVSSRRALEGRLRTKVEHFAYPDGAADGATAEAVAAAGYRFAYLVCGHRDAERPLLTQPRLSLWQGSCAGPRGGFSPAILSCQWNGVFAPAESCAGEHSARPRIEVPLAVRA